MISLADVTRVIEAVTRDHGRSVARGLPAAEREAALAWVEAAPVVLVAGWSQGWIDPAVAELLGIRVWRPWAAAAEAGDGQG